MLEIFGRLCIKRVLHDDIKSLLRKTFMIKRGWGWGMERREEDREKKQGDQSIDCLQELSHAL